METCPATGMPGMPGECIFVHMIVETDVFLFSIGFLSFIRTFWPSSGIPGLPGRDGRDGQKGEKGDPGI